MAVVRKNAQVSYMIMDHIWTTILWAHVVVVVMRGNDDNFCFILHSKSHLKKDPDRSANASDGPGDKHKEDEPQEGKDGILGHVESAFVTEDSLSDLCAVRSKA
jgi:hypothetical protein